MTDFGRRLGGGRRSADRRVTPLPCLTTTVAARVGATLHDISRTGARLCGSTLPPVGEQLVLKVGDVEAMAIVRWAQPGQCGVEFDSGVATSDILALERQAETNRLMQLTPEQSLAMQQWVFAVSR